jgi:hypothetical protein
MNRYWLTPIVNKSPLRFGAARICCEPIRELDVFRESAQKLHPRLLPLFKASLLLSDDEEHCGSELDDLALSDKKEIVFDGNPYHLSHCAEAFLDRLLSLQEAKGLVSSLDVSGLEGQSEIHQHWKKQWLLWLESSWDVILLREDGV